MKNIITMPCWNCGGEMKEFGHDSFYRYFKCSKCGKESAELREDYPGKTEDIGH